MFTVKDIITDAYDRTGIFPNATDELPGEYAALGLKLLQAIISQYNIKNYLIFAQQKLTLDLSTAIDEEDNSISRVLDKRYMDVDIASINSVLLRRDGNSKSILMEHIPFEIFENYGNEMGIYTYKQLNDTDWKIYFKNCVKGRKVSIIYNEKLDCKMTTVYYAPEEYKELFILALSSKLLTSYPRTSDNMKNSIDSELTGMINQIEAKQYNNKLQMYNNNFRYSSDAYSQFISGSWM